MAVAFSPTPASSSIHLLHPWPRLIKGLCVAPPAPIEVGTTNYPFIAAVVPSAQLCSPCPPLLSPSSKLKTKITFCFFPTKHSPPALIFVPISFSTLPWCVACSYGKTSTMEGDQRQWGRSHRSQHPPRQLLLLHQPAIKILFSSLPSHANHPAVIRAAAWLQGEETEARGREEFFQS